MKRLLALGLCSCLLLTGCQGSLMGTDRLEPANYINKTGSSIFPSVNETTTVVHTCRDFLDNLRAARFADAYNQLELSDTTFAPLSAFQEFVSSWVLDNATLTEGTSNGQKTVTCQLSSESVPLEMSEQLDGSWKIVIPSFTVHDFQLIVPHSMGITLDGKDISGYCTAGEDDDVYTIPELAVTPHEVAITTIFGDPVTMTIQGSDSIFDVSDYLAVAEPLRSQMFKLASTTLAALNKTVVARDWEKFVLYFAPDVQVANFSTDFDNGYRVKKDVYDFKLVEYRDLEQSDLDVRYTGYDTIEVTFGTRWTWSGKDDFKVNEKTGEVTVKKTSEMKMVNTVELQFDGKAWYVVSVDSESLARLTAGLQQWR